MTVAAVCAVLLAWSIPPVSGEFIAFGRFLPARGRTAEVIYAGEGMAASVAVTRDAMGILSFHNAGKIQTSADPQDMRLQRMVGHLTTLAPENPQSFLVIGCGAGVTAGAASINPEVERIVIAEIEPLVPEVAARYFGEQNHDVGQNSKVEIRIDDGRHYLSITPEKFDGIASDPLDPWAVGKQRSVLLFHGCGSFHSAIPLQRQKRTRRFGYPSGLRRPFLGGWPAVMVRTQ